MTMCTELSDRIPEVALGRSPWTVEEERHLTACADCRAEWTIISAARRLGSSLPTDLDPAGTTARLLERLARERARARARRRVWAAVGLAAAAAVALAVWTGAPVPVATGPVPSAAAPSTTAGEPPAVATPAPSGSLTEFPMPELDSLPTEVLDSILRALDEPLANAEADDAPLGDAGDDELEQALAGLEG